jgi:hypothetical protein
LKNNKLYCEYEDGITLLEMVQQAAQNKNEKEMDRLFNFYVDYINWI